MQLLPRLTNLTIAFCTDFTQQLAFLIVWNVLHESFKKISRSVFIMILDQFQKLHFFVGQTNLSYKKMTTLSFCEKKKIGRRPIFFFKQIGIFRKKGFPYEKLSY
jgi:hypothetical protein